MGKETREYPLGRLRFKGIKDANKDDGKEHSLMIEYSFNGNIRRKSTGIKVKLTDWNANGNHGRGAIKSSYGRDYQYKNSYLYKMLDDLDVKMREFAEKHHNQMNLRVMEAILKGEPITRDDQGEDFIDYIGKHLNDKYNRGAIGISRKADGESCMHALREFIYTKGYGTYKKDSMYIGEVTVDLLKKFVLWKKEVKHNKLTTINQALAPIICALEEAADNGIIKKELYNKVKLLRVSEKKVRDLNADADGFDGKYLTNKQMKDLIEFYNNDTEPRRKEFIEMFLFAVYACGMRIVDVMTLQWGHIDFERKEIRKLMVKVNKRNTIPLSDEAIDILKIWKEKKKSNRFVFDLLKDDIDLNIQEELYKARNNATKCINQALKVVGEKLELPFPLTFHKARHTFASFALNNGMNISCVSRLLGHESTSITERVYAMLLPSTLSDEVSKLDFSFT